MSSILFFKNTSNELTSVGWTAGVVAVWQLAGSLGKTKQAVALGEGVPIVPFNGTVPF